MNDEKLMQDFHKSFDKFIEHWEEKGICSNCLMSRLINEVKIKACFEFSDYYEMLGNLTFLLNNNLMEMFEDIENNFKEYEKENDL